MKALRTLRALMRLEWRHVARHPRRSLLVLALVAVPVAAIVGGHALAGLTQPSPEDRARQYLGRAELRVEGFETWERLQEAIAALPPQTPWKVGATGLERVSVPGTRLRAKLIALEPAALEKGTDPLDVDLASGMVKILEGRAPRHAGEVALSRPLLEGLELQIGDRVTLEYGGERTVTGIVAEPEELTQSLVLRVPAAAEFPGRRFLLAASPEQQSAAVAESLRDLEFRVLTRAGAAVEDGGITAFIFALGIIGLFEAGLVISAAFGVALRRRQVEIGLLGSVGATAKQIARALLVATAGLAAVGGVLGSILGYAGAALLMPFLEGWTDRLIPSLSFSPGAVLGAVLLGVLAAVAAAALPARSAARLPVREALAGRRPSSKRSRPWLVAGASLVASGVVLLFFSTFENKVLRAIGVTLGPIISILGFGACSPWLLEWTTRRATRLPLAWRLAVRDAGRFRERNAAVVTAVLASMAMSVTMAALVSSLESAFEAFPAIYRADQMLIEGPGAAKAATRMGQELPALAAVPLPAAYRYGEPLRGRYDGEEPQRRSPWIAVGGPELLTALGAESGLDAFRAGHLLALDAPEDVEFFDFRTWISEDSVATPPVVRIETERALREPAFVLSAAALERSGFDTGPPPRGSLVPWLVRLDGPVTDELLAGARAIAADSVRTSVDAAALHSSRFRQFYFMVFLICAVTGLIVVLTAVSLSAAESAADERVLQTVGASPRLLRGHQAARAGFLALLGCVLAIPAGLLAAAAFFGVINFPLTFVTPWRDLLMIGLALPALVYAGTWCFSRPKFLGAHTLNSPAAARNTP